MAKANNTAIEDAIKKVEEMISIKNFQQWEELKKEFKQKERRQLENAFNTGRNSKSYHDAQHYFFMQYVDND